VRAKPNAREDRLTRDAEGVLVARVAERPVDGKANRAIQALVARKLDVARSDVMIVSGDSARLKRVAIAGASRAYVQASRDRASAGGVELMRSLEAIATEGRIRG
jgi:hypothetical protein